MNTNMPNVRTRHGIIETWSAHNSWENRLPIDLCWWFICCVLVCPSEAVSFIISPALILSCLCDYMTQHIILNPLVCLGFSSISPQSLGSLLIFFIAIETNASLPYSFCLKLSLLSMEKWRCPLVNAVWHRFVCVCLYEKKSTSYASFL